MWDYENYPDGQNDEMYGIFYPEDLENIKQIDAMVRAKQSREMAKQQEQARKNQRRMR